MTRFTFLLALALPLAACESADDAAVATEPDPGAMEMASDPGQVTDDALAAPAERLNVNTATAEELATIPGVGDRMVHEFEEYRPYASLQQFRREIGKYVDEDIVAGYEAYLFVPVDPNASDAETMMQLPGVDAEVAQALIDGRPYASQDEFLTAYEAISGEPDATAASAFLGE